MNPIAWRYGSLVLRYSHLIFLLSFLVVYYVFMYLAKKGNQNSRTSDTQAMTFMFFAITFSRFGYILTHYNYYKGRWLDLISLWPGSFTLWGALLGIYFSYLLYGKKDKHNWKIGLNSVGIVFPLFLGLSQLGLVFEGEGWGKIASGLGTIEVSGLERYPLWLYSFFGYALISLIVIFNKSRLANFPLMIFLIGIFNSFVIFFNNFFSTKDFVIQVIFICISLFVSAFGLIKRTD